MPDHKNQHYVPRCHLKPFSVDGQGRAINVFHIGSNRLIRNAPIKSQCATDYFYGENLELEKALQGYERPYASIVQKILANEHPTKEEQGFLRDFSYLQYLRTDISIRRTYLAQQEMAELIFERVPVEERSESLSYRDTISMVMSTFADTIPLIDDLKVCLVSNKTRTRFITSDDPAIMLNRFYAQRLGPRWKSSGISNAGVMFYLPLSPTHLLIAYDGDVYTCTDRVGGIVSLTSEGDVEALNSLQFLKASSCIYFSDWADGELLLTSFRKVSTKRPEKTHNLNFAVKDQIDEASETTRFRVVHSREERLQSNDALVHLESVNFSPDAWCSKIKFRSKPKFIDTKSGAGFRRRRSLW